MGSRMSFRLLWFIITVLAAHGISHASVLRLDPNTTGMPVVSMEVFPRQNGSDEEVLARLQSMSGEEVAIGDRLSPAFETVWLRFTLENPLEVETERIIYLPNNYAAKNLDFYFYRDEVLFDHSYYRQDRPRPLDIIRSSSYASVRIPGQSRTVVYIKIESGYEQLNQTFQVSTRQTFINWEIQSTFFVGLFLGILFLTVLANFIQALAYRDKTFVWYSAYCASLMISSLSFYGVWVRIFSFWETQRYLSCLGGMLVLVSGIHFLRPLLDTKTLAPRLDRIFQTMAWVAVGTFFLRLFPETANFGNFLQILNSMLFMVLAIVACFKAMLDGKELAWLYFSSFIFIALSVIYVRLSHMNILFISPTASYAPAVCHILQVIMISYVMFIRSRKAYVESMQSKKNFIMNERLNLLLKIISHDLANPLQAISLYCTMAMSKVKQGQLPEKELLKAHEAIDTQTRIIRHAKEAVRQMQLGQKLDIQAVHVSRILDDVLQVFHPLCQDKGIQLEVVNELKEDLVIHTDATILVHNILGNILSNSIKFTPKDGLIRIVVRCLNRRLIFELIDNGPGISKEKRVEIFTLNVGKGFNEQLTGAGSFGLSILQMCSELLNGQLDIGPSSVSDQGQELGLRITVSLPLHHAL